MDARQSTTLNRCSGRKYLGLTREPGLEVTQESQMVGIGVVGCEPCLTGDLDM